jgi:hypothetical protein
VRTPGHYKMERYGISMRTRQVSMQLWRVTSQKIAGFHQKHLDPYPKEFSRIVLAEVPGFCEGVR